MNHKFIELVGFPVVLRIALTKAGEADERAAEGDVGIERFEAGTTGVVGATMQDLASLGVAFADGIGLREWRQ